MVSININYYTGLIQQSSMAEFIQPQWFEQKIKPLILSNYKHYDIF